jgi:uncharacterized protein (TIGR03086 family)
MSETAAAEFREIAGRFAELADGVRPEQWDGPSPVEEWAARDVVLHLVEWFPDFLEHGAGVRLEAGPSVDADPAAAWRHLQQQVQALLDDPACAARVLSNPHLGDVPLPQAVSQFFTADVFMHSWDLARATGQVPGLDRDRCTAMLAGMEPLDELLRASGQYGPRVPVPDDADPESKLMAVVGRDPQWPERVMSPGDGAA